MSPFSALNARWRRRCLIAAGAALILAMQVPANAAPHSSARSSSRPGTSHGAWHGGAGSRSYPRPFFRGYIPLPLPPLYYDPPAAYYPGYPYGYGYNNYDPSGAYMPPQDQGPSTYIEAPNYITSPAAATPQLPLEQRAQRLKDMCDKGLFTPEECSSRRQELLNQM
ncbi:MAG: hypothetical protein JWN73_2234 [Betaproteobacteria bacterium]|nr:hypothetical protein [Betaproteobacteria bacterium]